MSLRTIYTGVGLAFAVSATTLMSGNTALAKSVEVQPQIATEQPERVLLAQVLIDEPRRRLDNDGVTPRIYRRRDFERERRFERRERPRSRSERLERERDRAERRAERREERRRAERRANRRDRFYDRDFDRRYKKRLRRDRLRGYRGYRNRRSGYRYYDGYWFPPAAFIIGEIIRESSRPAQRYSERHHRWCERRYRSYRRWDGTFQPYRGPRRRCNSPYDGIR